jgi:hypothetical protein
MPQLLKPVHFEDAWSFFAAMSPVIGPLNADLDVAQYLYRGQGSDTHDLVPTAFRKNAQLLFNGKWRQVRTLTSNREQLLAELETVAKSHGDCGSPGASNTGRLTDLENID